MQNCCAVRGAVGAPCVAQFLAELRHPWRYGLYSISMSLFSSLFFYESRTKEELIGHRLMTESYAKSGGGGLGLRDWTFPEEDRAQFTTAPWRGEYRWFRSPNVICIEHWRRRKAQAKHTTPTHAPPELGRAADRKNRQRIILQELQARPAFHLLGLLQEGRTRSQDQEKRKSSKCPPSRSRQP